MCRRSEHLSPRQRHVVLALNLLAVALFALNMAHTTPALFTSGCALLCLSMSMRHPRGPRNPTGTW